MFVVLYLCWIIFNGNLTLEIALMGIPLTALVYAFMCKFLNWSFKKDVYFACFVFYGIDYVFISSYERANYSLGILSHLEENYTMVYASGDVIIYDVR